MDHTAIERSLHDVGFRVEHYFLRNSSTSPVLWAVEAVSFTANDRLFVYVPSDCKIAMRRSDDGRAVIVNSVVLTPHADDPATEDEHEASRELRLETRTVVEQSVREDSARTARCLVRQLRRLRPVALTTPPYVFAMRDQHVIAVIRHDSINTYRIADLPAVTQRYTMIVDTLDHFLESRGAVAQELPFLYRGVFTTFDAMHQATDESLQRVLNDSLSFQLRLKAARDQRAAMQANGVRLASLYQATRALLGSVDVQARPAQLTHYQEFVGVVLLAMQTNDRQLHHLVLKIDEHLHDCLVLLDYVNQSIRSVHGLSPEQWALYESAVSSMPASPPELPELPRGPLGQLGLLGPLGC